METALLNPPAQDVQAGDLADLMRAFTEVTGRLQATHESLRREVEGLQRDLREANEQLARSRRLAALGEMAAGIAHEVRNPLSSIRLYARMLEQDLAGRPVEAGTAGKIVQAVRGLDAVVGDVLVFARELRTRPGPILAGQAFERALEACIGEAPPSVGIELRDREVMLAADPALLQQALVNVVRNALQAMAECPLPQGGGHTLTLMAARNGARAGRPSCITLTVIDTGPGIPPEVVDRMFNPFFTTRATGTGLGLAIVHRIVDAHAGWVTAGPRPDGARGAAIELSLPAAQDAAARPPRPPARATQQEDSR